MRAGTEALLAIGGFGAAANSYRLEEMKGVNKLRNSFESELLKQNEDIIIVGKNSLRLPNTFMFCIPSIRANDIIIALDIEGFEVSSGSACSSGKVEPSRTLKEMGLTEKIFNSAVRVSLGPYNSYSQAKIFAKTVKKN